MILELTVDSVDYKVDITNNLKLLGELIINEIKNQIRIMKLQVDGDYLQRWYSQAKGDGVAIESGVPYSTYLEFGTYAFGEITRDDVQDKASLVKNVKKKTLPKSIRDMLPKGMVAFAPVRRVIYNQAIMRKLVKQAFASGV